MKSIFIVVALIIGISVKGQAQMNLLKKIDFSPVDNITKVLYDPVSKNVIRVFYNLKEGNLFSGFKSVEDYYLVFENGQKENIGLNNEPIFVYDNKLYSLSSWYIDESGIKSTLKIYDITSQKLKLLQNRDFIGAPLDYCISNLDGNILIKEPDSISLYDNHLVQLNSYECPNDISYIAFKNFNNKFVVGFNSVSEKYNINILVTDASNGKIRLKTKAEGDWNGIKNIFISEKYICTTTYDKLYIFNRRGEFLSEINIILPYLENMSPNGLFIDDESDQLVSFSRNGIIFLKATNGAKVFEKQFSDFYDSTNNIKFNFIEPILLTKKDDLYVLALAQNITPDSIRARMNYGNIKLIAIGASGNTKSEIRIDDIISPSIILRNVADGFVLITDKSTYEIGF